MQEYDARVGTIAEETVNSVCVLWLDDLAEISRAGSRRRERSDET